MPTPDSPEDSLLQFSRPTTKDKKDTKEGENFFVSFAFFLVAAILRGEGT